MKARSSLLAAATALSACSTIRQEPWPQIGAPPARLALHPFYSRTLEVDGIPVSSSGKVPDAALRAAASIIEGMLSHRPDLARAMVRQGQRVVVMAQEEGTTDLPEQADWKKPAPDDQRLTTCERKHYQDWIGRLSDREYWNGRARGMGGLLTSGASENLLGVPGTRYYGENIFVHEFSHAIMDVGIATADQPLLRRIEAAYRHAKAAGLWKGEYGETTVNEYWAEGTQFWFESNKVVLIDGRRILNADDLAAYDPALAAVLRSVYGNRHRLSADIFWRHPARVPERPAGAAAVVSTAAEC
ncbi:MAG: glycoside hydrolase [Sphingomonas phyllosphaerae]|uniref:glycoside hydrolase n=1 Tax=Sphingomonas phyllosphaerae TaxID=257003 RepID=UPI002FFC2130